MCAEGDARHSVGTELCGRCRARAADRGDARLRRWNGGEKSCSRARIIGVSSVSFDRRARRRDRRRGQERARDCRRHCRRARARRQRAGGDDHPRLCRADAVRPRLWREAGNAHRPVRPRRSGPHLLEPAIAQSFARRRARQGRAGRDCFARQAGGGRIHRARCCSKWRARRMSRCRSARRSPRCWTAS